MSANRWQQLYSKFFVLIVLGFLLLAMLNSLKDGLAGFDEVFFGKARLISIFNHLRYSIGDRVFPQVLVGKDGWLQFAEETNLDDYQNASIVPEQLESIHKKFNALNKRLTGRGITLVVVVAPNKATIYPDKVPDTIEKVREQSRLDILLELTKQSSTSYIIDVRPALIEAGKSQQLYYKTDTHWNAQGAYIAYREVMNAVSKTYPDLQPSQLNQFEWKESQPRVMDLPHLMGIDFIREPWQQALPKFETSYLQIFSPESDIAMSWGYANQERTLVMYHDSFGIMLRSFLQPHFKTAIYIRNRHPNASDISWINTINPDLVILEIVERDMPYFDVLLSELLKQLPRQN